MDIRVHHGEPSAEEIAALTTVLLAYALRRTESAAVARSVAEWCRRHPAVFHRPAGSWRKDGTRVSALTPKRGADGRGSAGAQEPAA